VLSDNLAELVVVSGLVLAVVAVAMVITALAARRLNRVSVVDVAWGLAFVGAAVVCAVVGPPLTDADAWRSWLLVILVAVWGGRLAWHILKRSRGHGEDPRYLKLLGGEVNDGHFGDAVRKVFVIQGLAVWLVSLPLQAAAVTDVRWPWLVWAGVVLSVIGLVIESVGDAQLAAYRAQPREQRPEVLDTGLWRYTRHPNYFGDACVWWGIWLAGALASGLLPAMATVVAPFAMTYFLAYATGARLLEQTMMERPGYRAYAARTSMFVPWAPRR
jgi:steroid 5-alpha reductase family enzyme